MFLRKAVAWLRAVIDSMKECKTCARLANYFKTNSRPCKRADPCLVRCFFGRLRFGGGGQEFGLRSGTENVPAIAGFGEAARLAEKERAKIGRAHV